MPPVPNVILARPGSTHPWPTSDACWSPMRAAIGGAPGSAVAVPTTPVESTIDGSRPPGMPSSSRVRSFHALPSVASSPVTAALLWSVTWRSPPDSAQATQVSTVPAHRSRSRAPSTWSSSQASLVADWLGASARSWVAFATMHSTTVRRSCQPRAGPIGAPVRRSQTTVLARWLVIPTAVIGSPAAATASWAASSVSVASAAASNSTSPGDGVAGGVDRRTKVAMRRSPSTTATREVVVPMSMTRIAVIDGAVGGRRGRGGPGRGGPRSARPRARR